MRRIVIVLLLGDCIALTALALIDHIYRIEALIAVTQMVAACFVGLATVACCFGDLHKMARDIGRDLVHPKLDATIIALIGTALSIGIMRIFQSPFAPTLAILVGLVSLETAWQFGHQDREHHIRIRNWNHRR